MCVMPPEPLYCDTCGEELQREACNHVRPCLTCTVNPAKIFAIVTLRFPEKEMHGSNIIDLDSRTVGWFPTIEEARSILEHNCGGLDECSYYPVAVIEPVQSGLYPDLNHEDAEFYYWNREDEKWVLMPKPPEDKAWLNYALPYPKKWGTQEFELVRNCRYASIG